jgi:hypothetical protein
MNATYFSQRETLREQRGEPSALNSLRNVVAPNDYFVMVCGREEESK